MNKSETNESVIKSNFDLLITMFVFKLHRRFINRNSALFKSITYAIQLNGKNATERIGSKFSSLIEEGDNILLYGY